MSIQSQSPQQDWPRFYVTRNYQQSFAGSTVIWGGGNSADNSALLLLNLDLVDVDLVEGNNAAMSMIGSTGGSGAYLIRAFTYASSQGTYAWRGQALIPSGGSVTAWVGLGLWDFTMSGMIVPDYAVSF